MVIPRSAKKRSWKKVGTQKFLYWAICYAIQKRMFWSSMNERRQKSKKNTLFSISLSKTDSTAQYHIYPDSEKTYTFSQLFSKLLISNLQRNLKTNRTKFGKNCTIQLNQTNGKNTPTVNFFFHWIKQL